MNGLSSNPTKSISNISKIGTTISFNLNLTGVFTQTEDFTITVGLFDNGHKIMITQIL